MSITKYYTTTFTVTRQTWSGDSSALVSQDSFTGHIQQGVESVYTESLGLRFTKPYTIWCPASTDVEEGDRITEGSNTYDVKYVENRNIGSNGHLHVLVEKHE